MAFIPHTDAEISSMLQTIGVDNIDQLFDEIPESLIAKPFANIPESIEEGRLTRIMMNRAQQDGLDLNFIGAGSYQHHIPAAIWDLVSRGEIMTAYTPYQAEASQGNLQLIYEYQTMMSKLMALDCSNASLYEGASALAEAVLMSIRANKKSKTKKVLVLGAISPFYREVLDSILMQQEISVEAIAVDKKSSQIDAASLAEFDGQDITAVVIPQPNFFGTIQAIDCLTDWAHENNALVIGLVNPMAMSLLKPPGQWGKDGADIACGEGQPLGVPMASGGPYFGFMCCKQAYVRQMPGRIVGRTTDLDGKEGFCLTLQAREQHIRRSKATSNICTNQGLLVSAATIYMSLLGSNGLRRVATASHQHAMWLKEEICKIEGVELVFKGPQYHEFVVRLPVAAKTVVSQLAMKGIQAGFELSSYFPDLDDCLLVCATEVHTTEDMMQYVDSLSAILEKEAMTASIA